MLNNLEEATDHPDMTEELADVLSTQRVTVEYHIETSVSID
jgi:biotin operon repressor